MLTNPRYTHVQFQVLRLFQTIPGELMKFPLNINAIIKTIYNCRAVSYETFAKDFNKSINDVIALCSSVSGCTHYERKTGRYLILYNSSVEHYNVAGRRLWTLGHELGHVVLAHPLIVQGQPLSENTFSIKHNPIVEAEADYFASQILAPLPLFKPLNINSPIDVEHTFGLSAQASLNQFSKYLKWENGHVKKSYENDLLKLFKPFMQDFAS